MPPATSPFFSILSSSHHFRLFCPLFLPGPSAAGQKSRYFHDALIFHHLVFHMTGELLDRYK